MVAYTLEELHDMLKGGRTVCIDDYRDGLGDCTDKYSWDDAEGLFFKTCWGNSEDIERTYCSFNDFDAEIKRAVDEEEDEEVKENTHKIYIS